MNTFWRKLLISSDVLRLRKKNEAGPDVTPLTNEKRTERIDVREFGF
jgi:hypothetical protein